MKKKPFKICIGPSNTAGFSTLYANSFRSIGIEATAYFYSEHTFGFNSKYQKRIYYSLIRKKYLRVFNFLIKFFLVLKIILKHDVIFYIEGRTYLRSNIDIKIAKLLGKKIIIMFIGCDIRHPKSFKEFANRNGYLGSCHFCIEKKKVANCRDEAIHAKLIKLTMDYADLSYADITNHHLLINDKINLISDIFVPINIPNIDIREKDYSELTIVHAPSNSINKRSAAVINAVERLKKEGYVFNFKLLKNQPNSVVIDTLNKSAIVLDEFGAGVHGRFSVEAMASGNVVLCHIVPEFVKMRPEIPIIPTTEHEIYSNLKTILDNPEQIPLIGQKSLEYARKYHSFEAVGNRMINDFKKESLI